ncbi:hypothetical protein [Pseudalkalibacillus decolorationis]|uniref:hypothetical protein n=1 Tax=Pseudalkalibacillus decolorationis TaxID=163879 RepID=UPI00214842BF|nr:hypothetical protein [Pseudalkalibacillus decolorationis]
MKPVKIPPFLHEVFGPRSTVLEITVTGLFAIFSTVILMAGTSAEWQGYGFYQIAVVIILALDINGGVIANFTLSTNNHYRENDRARLVFIALHIQPIILALILQNFLVPCLFIWGYTIVSSLIVNQLYTHPAQRTIGAVFMAFGLLVLVLFFIQLPTFLTVILAFYLIKVSFSFAVNHYALREE